MKHLIIAAFLLFGMTVQAKDLVAYFSAQGHTQAVAERIAELTGADIYRIEAAEPYAANPYDDSERIQNEAYQDLRPAVANPPSQEWIDGYDRIFVGTPCWWHQPAMVVCTFLENYDFSKHVIIPFVTYGATTYLNETMQKLFKCTPNSPHVPVTLPEDLDSDDITTPGRPDDDGIDMPGNAAGVEGWLERLGLNDGTGIHAVADDIEGNVSLRKTDNGLCLQLADSMVPNTVAVYNASGALVEQRSGMTTYYFTLPSNSIYLVSMVSDSAAVRFSSKVAI